MPKTNVSRVYLVWMDDLELLDDKKAYIEQGMIHSEAYNLSIDVPEYKTRRLRWIDSEKGPVPNGSEYVIAKTPNDPDDSDKFRYNLHIVFSEEQAGATKEQLDAAKRVNIIQNGLIILAALAVLFTFGYPYVVGGEESVSTPTVSSEASSEVSSEATTSVKRGKATQANFDVMYHYQNTETDGMSIGYETDALTYSCWIPCEEGP